MSESGKVSSLTQCPVHQSGQSANISSFLHLLGLMSQTTRGTTCLSGTCTGTRKMGFSILVFQNPGRPKSSPGGCSNFRSFRPITEQHSTLALTKTPLKAYPGPGCQGQCASSPVCTTFWLRGFSQHFKPGYPLPLSREPMSRLRKAHLTLTRQTGASLTPSIQLEKDFFLPQLAYFS